MLFIEDPPVHSFCHLHSVWNQFSCLKVWKVLQCLQEKSPGAEVCQQPTYEAFLMEDPGTIWSGSASIHFNAPVVLDSNHPI